MQNVAAAEGSEVSAAKAEMAADSVEDRFAALEKEVEIDRLLKELKERKE